MIRTRAAWGWQRYLSATAFVTLVVSACAGSGTSDTNPQTAGAGPSVGGEDPSASGHGGQTKAEGGRGAVTDSAGKGGAAAGSTSNDGAAGAMAGQAGDRSELGGVGGSAGDAGSAGDTGSSGETGSAGDAGSSGAEIELGANDAVAYRIDRAHSGAQLSRRLEPPFVKLWSSTFNAAVSYPLIVGTRVFVTTLGQTGDPAVFAFDRDSGTRLWESAPIASQFHEPAHLAYDAGLVITANDEGRVLALDANTGDTVWAVKLDAIYGFGTMPVAADGTVYLTGATSDYKNLFALDERDGSLRYRARGEGDGPATLVGSRLFISGGCHETFADEPLNGQVLWHYKEGCSGGGGEITVFHEGQLFVADSGSSIIALDATSGALTRSIGGKDFGYWPMAVVGDRGFLPFQRARGGDLRAFDLTTGAEQWSFRLDEHPQLPTLVTPGYAFVLTRADFADAFLQAVDLTQLKLVWTSAESVAKWTNYSPTGSQPVQGLAAGQGRIVVAFERTLTTFASVAKQ